MYGRFRVEFRAEFRAEFVCNHCYSVWNHWNHVWNCVRNGLPGSIPCGIPCAWNQWHSVRVEFRVESLEFQVEFRVESFLIRAESITGIPCVEPLEFRVKQSGEQLHSDDDAHSP